MLLKHVDYHQSTQKTCKRCLFKRLYGSLLTNVVFETSMGFRSGHKLQQKIPRSLFRGKKTFSGQIKTSVASTLPPHSPSLLFLDDWSLQMLPHEFGVSACLFVSHNEKEVNLFLWKRTRKQTFTFSWNRYLGYLKTETWRFPSVLSFLMFPDISVPRYSESRTNATLNIS